MMKRKGPSVDKHMKSMKKKADKDMAPSPAAMINEHDPSKPPSKHQLKSDATRAALMQAAESIFARDGYERAQIDEIAKKSGRTRGAVYAQYKTKEQLFFALQEQRIESAVMEVRALVASIDENDSASRLEALRQYYAELRDEQGAILDLELKLYALRHPESADEWRNRYVHSFSVGRFDSQFQVPHQPGTSLIASRVMALAALKSGLLLSSFFLPDVFTRKETKLLLLEVFDGLFPQLPRHRGRQLKVKLRSRSKTPGK